MKNEYLQAREKLFFKTPGEDFNIIMGKFRMDLKEEFQESSSERKEELAYILTELTIDLQSYLSKWNLQNPKKVNLPSDKIDKEVNNNYDLLCTLGYNEKVERAKQEVKRIKKSNLLKLSEMADKGILNNRWGNDYASGLTYSVRRGGIMVTTNPQLINIARKENPEYWEQVKNRIKLDNPSKLLEELASLMTMEVVLENCREMYPIFEATNEKLGYVSLQVNPKNYTDADSMVSEAEYIYDMVGKELGGTPNIIFKVPATKASLEAVKRLTSKGIGVNVTVNFTVSQEIAFAEVIEEGNAKVSVLTIMSGRLDDPVREELEKIGVNNAQEASTWAGIAVAKKCYDILYRKRKYKKSALLQASLRGPWHIDKLLTNEEVIFYFTVFPNKSKEYDKEEKNLISQIANRVPQEAMDILNKSDIFKKAFNENGLTVKDFDEYYPVKITLDSFAKSYDDFVSYLK